MPFQFPLTDAHVHPDFSIDAEGSIEDYCERALEIGLAEIIFTTHYDTNPKFPEESVMVVDGEQVQVSEDAVKRYAEAVWSAREKYYHLGLMVKCGIEVDFYPGIDEKWLSMLDPAIFEHRIAGIHGLLGCCLGFREETEKLYSEYPVSKILEEYYKLVRMAADYRFFDAIAHLDYYRRYAPKDKLAEVEKCDYDFITETLDLMAGSAIMMEVNTSAIRHGLKEYYPTIKLLNLARKRDVLIRHIGSDAHNPSQLATDFEKAEIIVYETNLHDISEG